MRYCLHRPAPANPTHTFPDNESGGDARTGTPVDPLNIKVLLYVYAGKATQLRPWSIKGVHNATFHVSLGGGDHGQHHKDILVYILRQPKVWVYTHTAQAIVKLPGKHSNWVTCGIPPEPLQCAVQLICEVSELHVSRQASSLRGNSRKTL